MSGQDSGIDQLIKRVKTEAIDRAEQERNDIIKRAHEEASTILNEARTKAESELMAVRRLMEKERHKFEAELEMAARDFSLRLNERLRQQMLFPIIKEKVRLTLKEPDFLKTVLQRLIVEYVKENCCTIDVMVSKELKTTLAAFFASVVFDELDKNCDIKLLDEDGMEGFVLLKRDEHFVWDFRIETVTEELMRLVEPSLKRYFAASKKMADQELFNSLVV